MASIFSGVVLVTTISGLMVGFSGFSGSTLAVSGLGDGFDGFNGSTITTGVLLSSWLVFEATCFDSFLDGFSTSFNSGFSMVFDFLTGATVVSFDVVSTTMVLVGGFTSIGTRFETR